MKEQIETAVPRRKLVAGDSDEARKTATGHSCKTLYGILKQTTNRQIDGILSISISRTDK